MSVSGRPRAKLVFKPEAFAKMQLLIMKCSGEVGWHGLVERNESTFTVTDILVYPQQVTGATITTDQPEYEKWNMEVPLVQFTKMRFHGHSHVNMGTTPSGIDISSKKTVLSCLREGQYYIFMIWNKSLEYSVEIYDAKDDYLIYENCDVDVEIEGIGDMKKYLDDSIAKIKRIYPTYTYQPGSTIYYGYQKPAQTAKPKASYSGFDPFDDYEDDYAYYKGYYQSHLYSGT